jgi:hypothetical protein
MRHNGAGDEECNARGNHAKGSGVGRAYYDYTEERGPSHYAVDGVTQLAQSHLARLTPSTMILADSDDSSGDDDDDGSEQNDWKKEVSRDRPLFKAYPRRVLEGGYPLHWS